MYLIFKLVFVTLILSSIKSNALKNITISKCCPNGETLKITKDEISCGPASVKEYLPTIYSPAKKTYVNPPKNWIYKQNFPECSGFSPKVIKQGSPATFILFSNGGLMVFELGSEPFGPQKYCIDTGYALVCEVNSEELVQPKVRVKKCCGKNAVYSELKKSCVGMTGSDYKIDIGEGKTFVEGFPSCNSEMILIGKLHEAELKEDGSLDLKEIDVVLPPLGYCVEHVLENAVQSASIFSCHDHLPSTTESSENKVSVNMSDLRLKLYPAGLLLSAVFLAATLAAGTVLPASHLHALHWRCQTNHVASLLVAYVLLAITQLASGSLPSWLCFSVAICMHFLFLAAFFWLNTMCFNIWWTFRDLRPASMEKRQEQWRLRLYEFYAWGGPLVIATVATVLDLLPKHPELNFLRPRFGHNSCWFYGSTEILTYFFGPVGVLLVINLVLFALTARELTCGLWKRELVKSTTERAALGRVCMKLVVVMGVTWIADVVSWWVGGPNALWYVTDLVNALQGVFIFIVVACQPQVWTAIKRLWCRRQSLANDITGNGNHHSSSSHAPPSFGDSVTSNATNTTRSIPLETNC